MRVENEIGPVSRALALLHAIVLDAGHRSLTDIAQSMAMPLATAHRLAGALQVAGYLIRSRRGYYHAGPMLLSLGSHLSPATVIAGAARPILARLARRFDCTAHLGIFEHEMVSYLVKAGEARDPLFTREDIQLEAYCSGLGKVLLAYLPPREQEEYLATGPFIRLTRNTIVEPEALRDELARTRRRGYAVDDREVSDSIYCVAVPVHAPDGAVIAAASLSFHERSVPPRQRDRAIAALRQGVALAQSRLNGASR